jgi:small ligand-binding sensory domain FIST
VAHPEAWIGAVETEADAVTVVLQGDRCEGAQLTIGGSDGVIINELLERNGIHRFESKRANWDHLWLVCRVTTLD